MIERTQEDIMRKWTVCTHAPMVTVRCTAYNHGKYIAQALDSFLLQETTFPFEIVIHDDASTDNTVNIIRTYQNKYPDIVKPIYETENQYSKKDGSLRKILDQATHGKYVALCEGDDYWCDCNKLQLQWEFMEAHPECSMCVHNSYFHYLNETSFERKFNDWTELHRMSPEEVFFGWFVHTSSYFYKNDLDFYPSFRKYFWSGDYAQLTLALQYGDVYCLPRVMSVYNAGNQAGVTAMNGSKGYAHYVNAVNSRIKYLKNYDVYSNKKFHSTVKARIAEDTMEISEDMSQLVLAAQDMTQSTYYTDVLLKQKLLVRIKSIWKYRGHICGAVWLYSMKKRHARQKRLLTNVNKK